MAPKLPERYETRIRLGRDGDVEEWLATDTPLDRPVLVRILDPAANSVRRSDFVDAAKAAALAHHVGLTEVYALGSTENPYVVLEWNGGVSVADRLKAGETLTVAEFLSNGPRLASGLAALHAAGATHGAIDTAAIGFSSGQRAKLGAFGRRRRLEGKENDTAALAAALRVSVTGSDIVGVRPSEVAEGLPHAVDTILMEAEAGTMTAAMLAASLRGQRPAQIVEPRSSWSWRWTGVSAGLIAAALLLSAIGVAIDVDQESPFLFPAVPAAPIAPAPIVGADRPIPASDALIAEPSAYSITGRTFPNLDDLRLVVDGARSTSWRTGSHVAPLASVLDGIGIAFTVAGTPRFVEIVATPGTRFEVLWSQASADDLSDWERILSGTVLEGVNNVQVPERVQGRWLLWITGLPEHDDGRFYSDVGLVGFLP